MTAESLVAMAVFVLIGAALLWDGARNTIAARQISDDKRRRLARLREQKKNPRYRPHYFELLEDSELSEVVKGRKPLDEYLGDAVPTELNVTQARAIAGVALRAGQTLTFWSAGLLFVGSIGAGAYIVDGFRLPGSSDPLATGLNDQTPEYWTFLIFAIVSGLGMMVGHFAERKKEGAHTLMMWAAHLREVERKDRLAHGAAPSGISPGRRLLELARSSFHGRA